MRVAQREIMTLEKVKAHSGVIQLIEVFQENSHYFMVFEHMPSNVLSLYEQRDKKRLESEEVK